MGEWSGCRRSDQIDLQRTRLSFLDFDEPDPAYTYFLGEGGLIELQLFASAAMSAPMSAGARILILLLPVSDRLQLGEVSERLHGPQRHF